MRLSGPLTAILLTAVALAGCTAEDDPVLRLAFVQPDDAIAPAEDPQRLADAIEAESGRETEIYFVQSTQVALQALAAGHADAAFVDGSAGWFGWQRHDLDVIAAQQDGAGRTYYIASAWVPTNSTYQDMEGLRGEDSCHTGLLKSAGMFMPLGWLIRNGYVERVGPDDISQIGPTADAFFGDARIPQSDADPYGGYVGALRCLSEDLGDVAFLKDTTPTTYCGADARDWCLDLDQYRELQQFGQVPSHPVMVGEIPDDKRSDLLSALLALSGTEAGQAVLKETTGGARYVAVDGAQAHLGDYAANLQHVPGMSQYLESKVQG